MDFWFILGVILKMSFILGVALLLYAPVFVLFERRQSAMFQDRLGPYMGGVKMPPFVIENIPLLQMGGYASAAGAGATALLALVMCFLGESEEPGLWLLPISWGTLLILAALGAPAQAVGAMVLPHLFYHDRLTLFGGLHALFDAVKAFTKEDIIPPKADKFLFGIAPIIAMIPAFALGAVLPFGPDLHLDYLFDQLPNEGVIDGPMTHLQVASLNVGILYMFAVGGTGVIAAAIAGYSSDNKFALLGGIRAASQMVSYEVTLGLSLVGCFMLYDTLRLEEMVVWQAENTFLGFLPAWGIFYQPLAFVLFFFASIAEYKRVPFDAPEGESEIVAGYFLEYSSGKWLMFMIAEFLEVAISSMLIAVIFFGGWDVPGLGRSGWEAFGYHFDLTGTNWEFLSDVANSHLFVTVVSIVAFLGKALLLGILSLQVRWTLPRFRYDQIMQLCWKLFLPLSLLNVFVTGILILLFQ
ncbi:MAG: NADH-quinone oxidoreductase subunit H [Deltaproteobacteria bacterium]|nr:NADH-quinone oxidoreductase subunit H [Deltaproteobacteria bacterium]